MVYQGRSFAIRKTLGGILLCHSLAVGFCSSLLIALLLWVYELIYVYYFFTWMICVDSRTRTKCIELKLGGKSPRHRKQYSFLYSFCVFSAKGSFYWANWKGVRFVQGDWCFFWWGKATGKTELSRPCPLQIQSIWMIPFSSWKKKTKHQTIKKQLIWVFLKTDSVCGSSYKCSSFYQHRNHKRTSKEGSKAWGDVQTLWRHPMGHYTWTL